MLDHINNLDSKRILREAYQSVSPEIEETIRTRLYVKGTRGDDSKILTRNPAPGEPYAASTIKRKQRKGQPTDRVTLKDTGDFYATISAQASESFVSIEGDTDKFTSAVDPEGVLDLTTSEWDTINAKVVDYITSEIRKGI